MKKQKKNYFKKQNECSVVFYTSKRERIKTAQIDTAWYQIGGIASNRKGYKVQLVTVSS